MTKSTSLRVGRRCDRVTIDHAALSFRKEVVVVVVVIIACEIIDRIISHLLVRVKKSSSWFTIRI